MEEVAQRKWTVFIASVAVEICIHFILKSILSPGVALRDSPVGLAGYILEKFTTWTNPKWKNMPDGGLTKKFTMTQLLDNVMIYWVTRSITTSMRLYSENFNKATFENGIFQG